MLLPFIVLKRWIVVFVFEVCQSHMSGYKNRFQYLLPVSLLSVNPKMFRFNGAYSWGDTWLQFYILLHIGIHPTI